MAKSNSIPWIPERHGELLDIGTLTHPELEELLGEINVQITVIQGQIANLGDSEEITQLQQGLLLLEQSYQTVLTRLDALTAADVSYLNDGQPAFRTVKDALDKLFFVPLSVSMSGGGTFEKGSTVNAVNLSWSTNKDPETQSINQGIGTLANHLRAHALTGLGLTTNRTWTLTVKVGDETRTASTTVSFLQKRYWGVSPKDSLTDADILALSSELSGSRSQNRTFDATGGRYLYIAYPTSYGLASFKVAGLAFSAVELTQRSFTNASGLTELYNIYRTTFLQNGSGIPVEVS